MRPVTFISFIYKTYKSIADHCKTAEKQWNRAKIRAKGREKIVGTFKRQSIISIEY